MLAAEPANPRASRNVRLTCGPKVAVTGETTMPGSRSEVFHIRLTPCGAFIAIVLSAGSLKCWMAVAV